MENPNQTSSTKKNILIVDDESLIQILGKTITDKLGYNTTTVSSGEDAIKVFKNKLDMGDPFIVIIMDLALPGGMSGIEATSKIKQLDPNVKIIASSGYLEQNSRQTALNNGFSGILPKPYSVDRINSELKFVLNH